jgi:plasmid maintenance system antidote protein VapI
MGTIIQFLARHARAPTTTPSMLRAAKPASTSAVKPLSLARSVAKTEAHHSAGILFRRNHLITAQLPAPKSDAIASREGQSSITDRNEVKSDMTVIMGLIVPQCKAKMSHDYSVSAGHYVPMTEDDEKIAESAWRDAFIERLKKVKGSRSQADMADLLDITRDRWNKIINRGDAVPTRLLPRLAKIGAVSLEWLIEGDKAVKVSKAREPRTAAKRGTG